ncbi:MAG: trigger factor [Clostridia bacterium]|nr:trigger factor [Clostridia bacterium]
MKYEVATAEKSTVKITMTFSHDEWVAANDKAYLANRKRYSVNGFRKGKAPKHVLELYYGKGLFYEDALNGLFSEHYGTVLQEKSKEFTAVGDPTLSVEDLSDEKVVLVAVTPVKPDVKIGQYKGIKINKFEYTVTDADVDADIESTRERIAEKGEATGRPAQFKDIAKIDFVGKVDGKEFDGGSAKGFDLTLGSHQFIPGFEEQVVGMNVGETKDIPVTFPEDYQAEDLKGKPAVFTVTLHKLTESKLAPLDDAFAKKLGSENMTAYRAKVKERLERNAASRSRNETENAIITEIAKTATAEIPDAMIEKQEDASMQRMEYNLSYQGIRLEDYLAYIGTTRDEYKKNFEEEARRTVLNQLIVEKLIEVEKITASAKEIDAKVKEQAASVGKDAESYKKTMDPRQLEYIEGDIKVTKLFDFLMANNEMVLFKDEKPAAKNPAAKKTAEKTESAEEKPAAKKPAAKKPAAKAEGEEKPAAKKPAAKKTVKADDKKGE